MFRLIYSLLLILALPFYLPSLYRKKVGKPSVGKRWKEHFGITPPLSNTSDSVIWIHAVSVGETIAAAPLVKKIKQQYPNKTLLLTTTTPTGAKQAETLAEYATHRYMPLDLGFAIQRFIKCTKPEQLIIIETELWPNTLTTVNKLGIPISVVNARLSDRSYSGYNRFRFITNIIMPCLERVICQHQNDANNFIKLGMDKEKVLISGSIKFDIEVSNSVKQKGLELRQQIGATRPVWIAASTHQGEDEIVLAAHKQLINTHPDTLLILVPRHPERFESVYQMCDSLLCTKRRTTDAECDEGTQVYLADTMGEMLTLIAAADICFMGGSLIGDKVGGHNMLEPAALSKPILTGTSFFNFTDITNQLVSAGACKIIESQKDLTAELDTLFSDKETAKRRGLAANQVVDANRGALNRTLEYLKLG